MLEPAMQQEYADILRRIDEKLRAMVTVNSNQTSDEQIEDDGWMEL